MNWQLNIFTFFFYVHLINSPPLVAIKDFQPCSGKKCKS